MILIHFITSFNCFTAFQSLRASLLAMWVLPPVFILLIFSSYITHGFQVYKGLPQITI